MDDTTLAEIISKGSCSNIPNTLRDVAKWSGDNQMNINNNYWGKTKEILVSMNILNLLSGALCVDDNVIKRVYSYKKVTWYCNSV